MDLDEDIHREIMGCSRKSARFLVADASHDDQDTIGAVRASFIDLVRFEEEILAQAR
jgi:hypothetical protein